MPSDAGRLIGSGDPSPIRVEGDEPAVLAMHGFGATPHEMRLVVEVAQSLGLRAYAPLLPGHGTHARDLAPMRFDDWARGAEAALDAVRGASGKVIAIGLSLGSLLAAHLALRRRGDVVALGLLANATRLGAPFPAYALKLVDRLHLPNFYVPRNTSDIGDPEARATQLAYGLQPVRGAIEVMRGGARIERILSRIDVPAFIGHGKLDRVCPVANASRVAGLLASREKTLAVYPRSHHILTRDYDREDLRRALTDFVGRVAGRRCVSPG